MIRFLLITIAACVARASIEEIPLPSDIQNCFDRQYKKGNLTVHVGEKLIWHCVHGSLWTRVGTSEKQMPKVAMKWFADLIHNSYREAQNNRRIRRQAIRRRPPQRQLRIRREYRLLSDIERRLFHRAINLLKADRTIPPNRFDALGRLHELLGERAHDGPNFLGWHRLFLILAENALREKVPSVTIPYWDSTLDLHMVDQRASLIWTPEFMGNGNGRIRTGAFAGWVTPYGPLMRNFGDGGTMMNWTSIRDTFSKSHIAEITHPQADPKANIEDHHGEPHLWVGGHMSPQALAGYDPIFLLLHSFIDLIWELFRRIQRRRGIDPTIDYPFSDTGPPGHEYNDPSGFGNLLNRHALSDIFTTEMYTYQLPPTCSNEIPTCGSRYIRCDTSDARPKCVAVSIFDTPADEVFNVSDLTPLRKKRNVPAIDSLFIHNDKHVTTYMQQLENAVDIKCQKENINDHYVNNFNIDGVTNTNAWSYLPLNVIVKKNNKNQSNGNKLSAAVYPKCEKNNLPLSVYVESNGLNYRGLYKEIAHVKNDVSVTSSIVYIAIRTPDVKPSELLLSAYDSCGRICRTFCQSTTLGAYRPCQGALRVDKRSPHLFGRDANTVSKTHWIQSEYGVPKLDDSKIFVQVVCDSGLEWPWPKVH
ncbi:uncharacterized protein LOC123549032 [Mercenaria mercenaria]|uniref:uncharacterized protein LOC123549032 n=1 Tax=Mercenaria mercenaria TaxID=6596 RepID=UPI00234FA191|nr:uncharacterized protein LOC123549032 [Mercenaria mercenaria]